MYLNFISFIYKHFYFIYFDFTYFFVFYFYSFIYFCFWPQQAACGILAPQPGMDPNINESMES